MHIRRLRVCNFKAITALDLDDLKETVVIAGPNGCGKSCVFDAIRLLKSVYGGYQPNEWQNWFGEFQLNVNQAGDALLKVFQKKDQPVEVAAEFVLSAVEAEYIRTNLRDLLIQHTWKIVAPETARFQSFGSSPLAANLRVHQPKVDRKVQESLPVIEKQLAMNNHWGTVTISPRGEVTATPSLLLELIFSHYDPQHIGIIDYHGANRNYGREQIGGVNLSLESQDNRLRQHALYNYSNKYANLKTEMAGSFVRHLLAKQANPNTHNDDSLSSTLKELFSTFFPGKEFLGPRATPEGNLLFNVRTSNGSEHDIDDLSSGEKEVLYGYLRLRNAAPRNSVLLIDEPELHLNPRLMNGLATFYHRHLARELDNQLWLVTHSDTLIREAVGQNGFSVFHMQPAGQYDGPNQASNVQVGLKLERLVVDLVGDLAAYRPGAKIVIFEGGEDSQFDVRMVSTLFPKFQIAVNPIPGGNKQRVTQLYELLEETRKNGHIPARFYAVTDSDGEPFNNTEAATKFSWDVYHIENYLLEPEFILRVLQDLQLAHPPMTSPKAVMEALQNCADQTVATLVAHEIRIEANKSLMSCLDLKFDPKRTDIGTAISEAAQRCLERVTSKMEEDLSAPTLQAKEERIKQLAVNQLASGEWVARFRGRDILRRFASTYGDGIGYEKFRDLIISRMRDVEYQPIGMGRVLDRILSDQWVK